MQNVVYGRPLPVILPQPKPYMDYITEKSKAFDLLVFLI